MSDLAQSAEGTIGVIAEIKILVRDDSASQNNDYGPNQLAHRRPIDFSWISTGPAVPDHANNFISKNFCNSALSRTGPDAAPNISVASMHASFLNKTMVPLAFLLFKSRR